MIDSMCWTKMTLSQSDTSKSGYLLQRRNEAACPGVRHSTGVSRVSQSYRLGVKNRTVDLPCPVHIDRVEWNRDAAKVRYSDRIGETWLIFHFQGEFRNGSKPNGRNHPCPNAALEEPEAACQIIEIKSLPVATHLLHTSSPHTTFAPHTTHTTQITCATHERVSRESTAEVI